MEEGHVRESEAGQRGSSGIVWGARRKATAEATWSAEVRDCADIDIDSPAAGHFSEMEGDRSGVADPNGRGFGQGNSKECGLTRSRVITCDRSGSRPCESSGANAFIARTDDEA